MKILYVDRPFANRHGGDKNRSRWLWKTLNSYNQVDLAVVMHAPSSSVDAAAYGNPGKLLVLPAAKGVFPQPESMDDFSQNAISQFRQLVEQGHYDAVVFRFVSACALADVIPDGVKIIVDADMLLWRISALAWKENPCFKNRFHFIQKTLLQHFERKLFRKPWLFMFTNPEERHWAARSAPEAGRRFVVVPNCMPDESRQLQTVLDSGERKKYLLFFGALDSTANKDAIAWIQAELLACVAPLIEQGYELWLAGKNPQPALHLWADTTPGVKLLPNPDNMQALIAGATLCWLPLRVASGTRTRILEAAAMGVPVCTTAIGAEGLDVSAAGLWIHAHDAGLTEFIRRKLRDYPAPAVLAQWSEDTRKVYGADVVGNNVQNEIEAFQPRRPHIALVLNRFWPEVGGAETNLYFQCLELSREADVTVYTPLRIKGDDTQSPFWKTVRMHNVFSRFNNGVDLNPRALCPALFFYLLFGRFTTMMIFPAPHLNGQIAGMVAFLRRIPYLLCCFDLVDYAQLLQQNHGKIPSLDNSFNPSRRVRALLGGAAQLFAIAWREIRVLERYNRNVAYSPVPVLPDEYLHQLANPRIAEGISPQDFVYLSLGRVSLLKGQDIALDAFCKIAGEQPDAHLVLVGRTDYEPALLEKMQASVKACGLEHRVHWLGMLEREAVIAWLQWCDIHLVPVRFMNSGAVIAETWAAGRPVIQSDAVDPDYVVNGENGWTFASENTGELVSRMQQSYGNRDQLSLMGEKGRQLVLQKLTYQSLMAVYRHAFQRIAEEKSHSPELEDSPLRSQ